MTPGSDGLPEPRRTLAALAIWTAMAITVLDTAIVNVGLPTIVRELAVKPVAGLWIVQGYQLAIVAGLLPCAALGETLGYRRVYLAGLALFTISSLGCALSASWAGLVAARVLQGLGAAAIMGVNGALVRYTFPAARLGQALGINALVISASALAAPAIGGAILTVATWPWLFGINLALGASAFALGARALPEARGAAVSADVAAALGTVVAVLCLFGGVTTGLENRDGLLALGSLAVFAVTVVWLWRRSSRQSAPLLPVDLMRKPFLARAYVSSVTNFAAQGTVLVALPFHLHQGLGYSPLATGLLVGAIPLGLGAAAPWAGRYADRHPASTLSQAGLWVAACGLAGYALFPGPQPLALGACGLLAGAGFGLFQGPNNRRMLAGAPRERSGAAAGMLALSRLTGQIGGVVLAGLVLQAAGSGSGAFGWVAAGAAAVGALLQRRRNDSPID